MIVYIKQINGLEAYKDINGKQNVIFTINWSLFGEQNGVSSSAPYSTFVPYIAGQPFTPYEDLTKEQVISWIDIYTPPLALKTLHEMVRNNIENESAVESPRLPWEPPAPNPNITN